jgi:hypothetical protein
MNHQTQYQSKRPRMSDSVPREDTASPGPPCAHALSHHPQVWPASSRTGPTASAHPWCQALPPCTQGVAPTPAEKLFARDSCNKTAASAHGIGSGDLAVDAMAIGCLGMDRHGERFFVLNHFASLGHFSPLPYQMGPRIRPTTSPYIQPCT